MHNAEPWRFRVRDAGRTIELCADRHGSCPAAIRAVTVGDHFERVAAVYESLRTTDEAPVRRIRQLLP